MTSTIEDVRAICDRIVSGEDVFDVCRDDPDMLSLPAASDWLAGEAGAAYRQQHAQECELVADFMLDDLLEIADHAVCDTETASRRIEVLKHLMGALAPEKYGDTEDAEVKAQRAFAE